MTTPDLTRLHQRIDELVEKIGELSSVVAQSLAACESCRPFVLGGKGQPPLSDRIGEVQHEINDLRHGLSDRIADLSIEVTVLKTAREIGGRLFLVGHRRGRDDFRGGGRPLLELVARPRQMMPSARRKLGGPYHFPPARLEMAQTEAIPGRAGWIVACLGHRQNPSIFPSRLLVAAA